MKDKRDGRTPKYHGFQKDRTNPHRAVRCHNKIQCSKYVSSKYVSEYDIYLYCIALANKNKKNGKNGWRSYIGRHYCSCCGPANNKKTKYMC